MPHGLPSLPQGAAGVSSPPHPPTMGVRGGDVGNVQAFTPGGPSHHQALALHNHQIKMHEYHNLQMKWCSWWFYGLISYTISLLVTSIICDFGRILLSLCESLREKKKNIRTYRLVFFLLPQIPHISAVYSTIWINKHFAISNTYVATKHFQKYKFLS